MSKSLIYKMRCGCEFWEGLDYGGEVYPEMQYCTKHDDLAQLRNRIKELENKLGESEYSDMFGNDVIESQKKRIKELEKAVKEAAPIMYTHGFWKGESVPLPEPPK